ncbi:MAG: tRNA (N(6)-L-threonylcarbamoyladenosine(37)-C(2))-methylthiotransferase MtaB [Clostridia bacterium]|nr:tRNA (N(6)-L-threonylcarbamoyladenosine(37)-C(2))-methylthiotransferase MtaB [Clostridia bacterium]
MTFKIYTLGCKVNQYESEAIAEALEKEQFDKLTDETPADAYIINTCTVTGESDRKARQLIRRVRGEHPGSFLIVTGCLSQTQQESVASIEGVDFVCGNRAKLDVVQFLKSRRNLKSGKGETVVSVPELTRAPFEKMQIRSFDRTRAYIKIEDGCNHYCTYCAIPYARGNVRSKDPTDVLDEIRSLSSQGVPEVVLTGIETGSYGQDLEDMDLGKLLRMADTVEGVGRIRLGSLDPRTMTPEFVKILSHMRRIARHFHLSMQSGSDSVLSRMHRFYTVSQAEEAMQRAREALPGVLFTTDIITGFPGESEEDFRDTLDFVRRNPFLHIHIFPYSQRKMTKAAAYRDQVPVALRRARALELANWQSGIVEALLEGLTGQTVDVLFETCENGFATGHTDNFIEVRVRTDEDLRAKTRKVRLMSHTGETMEGVLI